MGDAAHGQETQRLHGVPIGRRQVTLLVGADRTLINATGASAQVDIREGTNYVSARVRYAGARDRTVELR